MTLNRILTITATILALMLAALCAWGQPIMPVMSVDIVDTNTYAPQLATAKLQWNKGTNVAKYRWTNWNSWTNQGGITTNTNASVIMILGTNRAGVRAENSNGSVFSAWSMITNKAVATNMVGIPTISTRTMSWSNGTWSPWMIDTNRWFKTDNFQQQWRLNIVQSNWWRLDKL